MTVGNRDTRFQGDEGRFVDEVLNLCGGETFQVVRQVDRVDARRTRPRAQQDAKNLAAGPEVGAGNLHLVIEASLANDGRIEVFEPVGRRHNQQAWNLSMSVQLLKEGVDHLLLLKRQDVLTLARDGVELVEEEQTRRRDLRFTKHTLDRFGCATDILTDGASERDAQETQAELENGHRVRCRRF